MTNVLVVDENPESLQFLRALLRSHGYEVVSASSGARALEVARLSTPDVLICDLSMPVRDGGALLRQWRSDPVLRLVPVVMYSAVGVTDTDDPSGDQSARQLVIDLGSDSFLPKVSMPQTIVADVRKVIEVGLRSKKVGVSPPLDDVQLLESYSRALVSKLEEKMAQLEATNRNLDLAQHVASIGSWEVDVGTLTVRWSDETFRIFGMAPGSDQPTIDEILAMFHPVDRPAAETSLRESLRSPTTHEIEHRLLISDGVVKHVVQRWQVFVDDEGAPLRAVGTCHDVTTRTLHEHELRRGAALLRAVADSTPDCVFVKDIHGRYLLLNEAGARFVQRTTDEAVGNDDAGLFAADQARELRESDILVMRSDATISSEVELTGEGGTRIFLSTKSPYRDASGEVMGVVGIARDVTEWREALEALRESEERARTAALKLSNVVDHSPDLICSFDRAGRFHQVNGAFTTVLGYSEDELIGRSALASMLPEDRASTVIASEAVVAGTPTRNFENRHRRKDGSIVNIQWSAYWSPTEEMMFCVGRDVTETRLLEAQVLRAQRLESIGTLAGGIAHDLNNVLAPIMLSIELLKLDEADEGRRRILDAIDSSARRGADMVKQVLSFARGVEGRQVVLVVPDVLTEVAKIALDTFPKDISIDIAAAPDVHRVRGDSTQLQQVLLNLCVNARDAMMHSGGQLSVGAKNVELDEHEVRLGFGKVPGPHVLIEVRDSGVGMERAVIDRAFEPFFTTKGVAHGTGLGLSTSLAIIASHHGTMSISSEPGCGTVVSVYLPATDGQVPFVAPGEPLVRGRGQLILVVDDEEPIRRITHQTLEAFGYRVIEADNGDAAAKLFATHGSEIAAVITDMMMPVQDGPSLIRALKETVYRPRIIGVSGLGDAETVAVARGLGVADFVSKPYSAETMLTVLHHALTAPR